MRVRSGPRESENENRGFQCPARSRRSSERTRACRRRSCRRRGPRARCVALFAALSRLALSQGLGAIGVRGGFIVRALRIQELARPGQSAEATGPSRSGFPARRRCNPVPPGGAKPSSPPPAAWPPRGSPICNCASAKRGSCRKAVRNWLRRPEGRPFPPERCLDCRCRQSPAAVRLPGDSRRGIPETPPEPSRHRPSCNRPRQDSDSAPGAAIAGDRLFQLRLVIEGHAQVAIRLGTARLQLQARR